MAIRLGINGFGRIGRQVTRIATDTAGIDLVAINDIADKATNAHLLKYDSTYGPFKGRAELDGEDLIINGDRLRLLSEMDPAKIPWGELGVDYVLESTGKFTTAEGCALHLAGGAKRVILSAPAKGPMPMYVMGVNNNRWVSDGRPAVISNASCTTNCLAPMAKVLVDNFGIEQGLMNTIHSYTNDQRVLDTAHKDLRRSRAAAQNIIPTSTGAAKAIGEVIPELAGKLDGFAVRVPTATGSLLDLTFTLSREASADELNAAFEAAAEGALKGILRVTKDPIVSSDIIQDDHSCIIDGLLTRVIQGRFAKVVGWYDNEWGYSRRCVDLLTFLAETDKREQANTA